MKIKRKVTNDQVYRWLPTARRLARTAAVRTKSLHLLDDLISASYAGLMHALSTFDVTIGKPIESWVAKCIYLEIMNELRRNLPLNHKHIVEVQDAMSSADPNEAARASMTYQMAFPGSLDAMRRPERRKYKYSSNDPADNINHCSPTNVHDLNDYTDIDQAMHLVLTPKERNVLNSIYHKGFSAAEVAKQMNLSTPRIFQIRNKALASIRRHFMRANNKVERN